ncbi:MAG: hypothetical protein FWF86_02500, partial [Clostridia bacterium]|nr:hypothetical protein [Clostridia bacterium]
LGGRKCAGILCETVADGDGLRYIVMGAGVNVSQRIFKGELREKATSLWIAARAGTPGLLPPRTDAPKPLPVSARSVSESCPGEGDHKRPPCGFPDRQTLLLAYLLRMEAAVEAVELAGLDGILAEYARRSVTLGGRVRVEEAGKAFTGIAEGLDETGALLVRETAGSPRDGSQDGPEPAGFDERAAPRPHAKGAAGPGLRRVLSGDVSVRGVMGYVETKV